MVQARKNERSVYAPVCVTLLIFILSTYFIFLGISSQAEPARTSNYSSSFRKKSFLSSDERIFRNVSRPLLASQRRRYIIITAGTYSYREYLSNLACSLGASKSRFEILLFALDSRLHLEAKKVLPGNVHTVLFSNIREKHKGPTLYGTAEFASLSRRKLAAARSILNAGYDVLFVDGDVVFCDPEAAISTMETLVSKSAYVRSDIIAQRAWVHGQMFNTGFYYARSNRRTIALMKAAENKESPNKPHDDQIAMNQMACDAQYGGVKILNEAGGCIWRGTTRISLIPNDYAFPLGCTTMESGQQLRKLSSYRARELCETRKIALVHYSCWTGGAKKASMIARGMWLVNEKVTSQCPVVDIDVPNT